MIRIIIGVLLFLIISIIGSCGLTKIDTGERGVVLSWGRYNYTMSEGLNFSTPIRDRVITMNIRDQNYECATEVSSADMQTIKIKTNLIYALDKEKVGDIYKAYKEDIQSIVVKPTLLEVINSTVAAYPIEVFVEKRAEISDKIREAFIAKTNNTGIVVKSLLITEHDFSDEYNKAIERKKIAQQEAQTAAYKLETSKKESEAQTIRQKSLNDLILKEKFIEKWDGKLPTYVTGDNNLMTMIKP